MLRLQAMFDQILAILKHQWRTVLNASEPHRENKKRWVFSIMLYPICSVSLCRMFLMTYLLGSIKMALKKLARPA